MASSVRKESCTGGSTPAGSQDKGMLAYLVGEDGEQGEVIREFPKKAGKLIMTRQLVGG